MNITSDRANWLQMGTHSIKSIKFANGMKTSRSRLKRLMILTLMSVYGTSWAFGSCSANGEETERTDPIVHTLSVSTGVDYVANSIGDEIREEIAPEDRIKVNTSVPLNLRYSFSFTDPKIRHYLPGGYQGISLGVLNFGGTQAHGLRKSERFIGYPVLAYVFQGGPIHRFDSNLSLNYEWNFGASFGWKPYSEANKEFNLTVGSRVNAYLHLGFNLCRRLTDHTSIFAGIGISHFSNGNTSFPNPGVNSFGVRVGMNWTLNPPEQGFPKALPDTVTRKKIEYDISAWGSTRKRVYRGGEEPVLLPGHFACAGISFSPMVNLNSWWRVGGSLDLQWDRSSDMKKNYISGETTDNIRFSRPSFWRQVTIGISAHGELRMPIFAVNVGCGYNLKAPWENRGFYQNITLKTYVCDKIFLNVGYQLRNFYQQSSLMLGAGVTL